MNTICICYDLNRPGQDYTKLFEAIEKCGSTLLHVLDSTWFVVTSKTAIEVRNILQQCIDQSDDIIVFPVGSIAAWYGLSEKYSSWLKNNWKPG